MFYHNATTRDKVLSYNPFYLEDTEKRQSPIWEEELTNDWDSVTELSIWNDYLQKTIQPSLFSAVPEDLLQIRVQER